MRIRSCFVGLAMTAVGCATARQETTPPQAPKEGHVEVEKKEPKSARSLSYPESLDRGVGRLLSMGMNGVEGLGRDMDHDGLVMGVIPAVANFLTEGIIGDLFVDGIGGAALYIGGADDTAREARVKAARVALRTHLSLIPSPRGNANIEETEEGYWQAPEKFAGQIYPVNFDQSLGALVGMPFGIVRQIGRNFDDNGFVVGLVELVPNTLVSIVGEVGGGLGKFATLIVGQGKAAESIDIWQRDLESNNKLITGH
jgi:hypothetical protein